MRLHLPPVDETDMAPQLVITAILEATLLALRRVLDTAHPALAFASQARNDSLSAVETLAKDILQQSDTLRDTLDAYYSGVQSELIDRLQMLDDLDDLDDLF